MSRYREPVLKRCRYLGISPTVIGIDKESNRKKSLKRQKKVSEYAIQLKEKQKLIIMSMVTTAVIVISLFSTNYDQTLKTSVNVGSTKTIGWGIKRAKNNMQPDVGTDNRKMLEENSGICLGNDREKVIYLSLIHI